MSPVLIDRRLPVDTCRLRQQLDYVLRVAVAIENDLQQNNRDTSPSFSRHITILNPPPRPSDSSGAIMFAPRITGKTTEIVPCSVV